MERCGSILEVVILVLVDTLDPKFTIEDAKQEVELLLGDSTLGVYRYDSRFTRDNLGEK